MQFKYRDLPELRNKLVSEEALSDSIQNGSTVLISNEHKSIIVGKHAFTKINVLLGVSLQNTIDTEKEKIQRLNILKKPPDIITDLSIVNNDKENLYEYALRNTESLVCSIPIYRCFDKEKGIDKNKLIDEFIKQAESGVKLFVIHITPNIKLTKTAFNTREIPLTSRGGGIIVRDMIINNRKENILIEILPELISISKKHHLSLSIAASFRPAAISDAFDQVHIMDILQQFEFAKLFHKESIGVIIESPGHCNFSKIELISKFIRANVNFPVMPLGPMPTDASIGQDHISSSIGAALFGYFGCADILSTVTRQEHTGNIPSIEAIIEAYDAARVVGHSIDIDKLNYYDEDNLIKSNRGKSNTCVVNGGLFNFISKDDKNEIGCNRCEEACPFHLKELIKKA